MDSAAPAPEAIFKDRGVLSVASMSPVAYQRQSSHRLTATSSSRSPEFFSQSTFQVVLQSPTIAHQLLQFAHDQLCGENMDFLAQVQRYTALLQEVRKTIIEIHKNFLAACAPTPVNLPDDIIVDTDTEAKLSINCTLPALEATFANAQARIEQLVYDEIYR
jgi:hypothetical protein